MSTILNIFTELEPADVDWIYSISDEISVISKARIIEEGQQPEALYVVLEGLVEAVSGTRTAIRLGTFGPGEILGEISFLGGCAATATILAQENSLLLAISWESLREKLLEDAGFGARLYRALALSSALRLSTRSAKLADLEAGKGEHTDADAGESWSKVASVLKALKDQLFEAERHPTNRGDRLSDEQFEQVRSGFERFVYFLNEQIGTDVSIPTSEKLAIGARVQRELRPYIQLANCADRFYSKPRGYAGDYFTIELMYRNEPQGIGRLGPAIDACFLGVPSSVAVRNRRGMLAGEILATAADRSGDETRVTSLASGPAAEVFDAFEQVEDPKKLWATLVDIDLKALAHVADRRDELGLRRNIQLQNLNLIYLATARQKLELPKQHLIYSIGLIDYFNDGFVVKLLNWIYKMLDPGGRVILGNFHPRNPMRAMMDHVLDWELIHRSEADMNRLFEQSDFRKPCNKIVFEDQRINLFAEGIRG